MRSLVLVLVVLGGCSRDSQPANAGSGSGSAAGSAHRGSAGSAGGTEFDQAIVDLGEFKTKMCACTTQACADGVQTEFKTWRTAMRGKLGTRRPSKEQSDRGNVVDREMRACRDKLGTTTGGSVGSGSGSGSGSAVAVGGDPIEKALVELAGFRTKMCACKTTPCADQVQTDFKTWKRGLRTTVAERPNKEQDERGNVIDKEMKACRKLAAGGAVADELRLDTFIAKMEGFRDKLCACTDKACGDAVSKDVTAYASTSGIDLAGAKPTKDQDAKAHAVKDAMAACKAKLK